MFELEEQRPALGIRLRTHLQYTAATISLILGLALLVVTTNWFAESDTKHLNTSTDVAFTIGILTGILQLGSTLILCFMGLRSHWMVFFWFTLVSFLGSLIVFIFAIIENKRPEAPNAKDIAKEEILVIVVSSHDFAFGLIFLIASFIEKAVRHVRGVEVPYSTVD